MSVLCPSVPVVLCAFIKGLFAFRTNTSDLLRFVLERNEPLLFEDADSVRNSVLYPRCARGRSVMRPAVIAEMFSEVQTPFLRHFGRPGFRGGRSLRTSLDDIFGRL